MLSELAPRYDQPIQTIGFSTGGNPASAVAVIINTYFRDPRYTVNRMTLLDSWCDYPLEQKIAEYNQFKVPGEPAMAEVYRSFAEPLQGALNISFYPGGDHNTPFFWYLDSMEPATWTRTCCCWNEGNTSIMRSIDCGASWVCSVPNTR